MFNLSAIDRHERVWMTKAAQRASGQVMRGFRSIDEGRALAFRFQISPQALGTVDADGLHALMAAAKCCAWCQKSLGQKRSAVFMHRHTLGEGGVHALSNVVVSCLQCARARVDTQITGPDQFRDIRTRRVSDTAADMFRLGAAVQRKERGMAGEPFHAGWVYAVAGEAQTPWVFLAHGAQTFTQRMQHIKHNFSAAEAAFMVAEAPFDDFRGLVVKDETVAQRILRDVQRAGQVEILAG